MDQDILKRMNGNHSAKVSGDGEGRGGAIESQATTLSKCLSEMVLDGLMGFWGSSKD